MPPLLLEHRASYDSTEYKSRIPNRPLDCRGACQSSWFEGKTRSMGQSCLERPERGMKRHKGWPAAGASEAPSRGPDILMLHI
jgi:hypothetical protein